MARSIGKATSIAGCCEVNVAWHTLLISGAIIGVTIWLIEQNVSDTTAMIVVLIILLGITFAHPEFATELQALVKG